MLNRLPESVRIGGKLLLVTALIITPPLWWLYSSLTHGSLRTRAQESSLREAQKNEATDSSFLSQHLGITVARFQSANQPKQSVFLILNPHDGTWIQEPKDIPIQITEEQWNILSTHNELHHQIKEELSHLRNR